MIVESELSALRDLLSEDHLTRLDQAKLADLRREYSGVPEDYCAVLRDCGFGGLRGSRFMLYGGPASPASIFDSADPICRSGMLLVGDDFSGGHLAYLTGELPWRLCFFDHSSLATIEPEADNSLVRFLLTLLRDPDD